MSCICEVLLSISGAGHIRHLCKMHFGISTILYDFQSIRCEKKVNSSDLFRKEIFLTLHTKCKVSSLHCMMTIVSRRVF